MIVIASIRIATTIRPVVSSRWPRLERSLLAPPNGVGLDTSSIVAEQRRLPALRSPRLARNDDVYSSVHRPSLRAVIGSDRAILRIARRCQPLRRKVIVLNQQTHGGGCACCGEVPVRGEPRVVDRNIVSVAFDA